jgi:two-component system OmpR family sensor kinase
MGRLFWKFFLFIWLVQLLGMLGVGASFWLRDHIRAKEIAQAVSPQAAMHRPPPHHEPKHLPPHGPKLLPPPEMIIANLLVGLLAAGGLAWYFAKPIRNLRTAFDAAADGKLETRLGGTMGRRRDELADLSRDFDHMAERLQTLMSSQRHLLHDVSHELRSPLARLQAAIGLARQTPDKLAASMDRIELESTRIDALVGELLTLSRLEAGVTGDLSEEINLGELVADIVEDARFEASIHNRTVEFLGDCEVIVRGRAELLGRAIENVVRNAIKHTPQGSWVLLQAEYKPVEHLLQLKIRDNGPGVPEAELQKIFEPFFRSSTSTDGHGLGLAIAHRVVQAHGGSILARNCAGGGLSVEMTFPVLRTA